MAPEHQQEQQQEQQEHRHQQQHEADAAGPLMHQEQLWDAFVVVGLPKVALQTITGDAGFLGTDQKYKPAFVDSLPHTAFDDACRLPPQLPTCCLPAGIDIVLFQDLDRADLTPHTFSCVLTGGDGTQLYASCLTFYDRVPSDLAAKHEDLLGAVALKALCLLSKRPYLTSSQQVLRELYSCAFQRGSSIPVPDLINSLLAVPCPAQDSPKLCLRLCGSRHVLCPPLPIGPPPGEVSLQPLLEVMQPDSLVGLFAAVLLEQRVLLRSRHHWLLTVAAEGVVRLLYPLKFQHVYIPVMPSSLADYLEAPTPFLMGLHSSEPVDQRTLDMLVVADLDRGTLQLSKDDSLLQRCLSHPYMQRLERRVRVLMQPSVTEADVVPVSTEPEDPWVAAAKALGPAAPWTPSKQALLLRVFMEFFHEVLRDHQRFLCTSSQEASERASLARRDSRVNSTGGSSSSSGGSSGGAPPGSSRVLRGVLSGAAGASGLHLQPQVGRSNSLAAGAGAALQAHSIVGMQALLDHHYSLCRHKDAALVQHVMQGLPFLSFVGEHNSSQQEPAAWLAAGESSLGAWRAAEEELQSHTQPAAQGTPWQEPPSHVAAGHSSCQRTRWLQGAPDGDGFAGTVVCIPDQPPSALMQPSGLLQKSFPALVLSEYSERSLGGKRRKTAVNRQKRPSVGRRRAISELMGSPLDLRRKTPPTGTSTDTSPPRLLRGNALDTGAVTQLQPTLAPGLQLPSLAKISNVSSGSTNASLSEEYSTEAELIGRQIGMLVHLMQVASAAAAAAAAAKGTVLGGDGAGAGAAAAALEAGAGTEVGGSSGCGHAPGPLARKSSLGGVNAAAVLRRYSSNGARSSRGQLAPDVLEAACQLLCIQTGGNGWFIVSRLKELVANPPAPCTDSDCEAAAAAGHARAPSRCDDKAVAPTAAAAAAGKKGGDASQGGKGAATQGKTMLAKSGKILGVNLSGGSSSSSKSSGLAGLKVSHGVESFASAASAMASVISRNTSSSKQKQANSPTNTGDTSKVSSSAPSSTSGGASASSSGPAFQHSMSCRLDDREHTRATTGSEGGSVAPPMSLTCSTITEGVPSPPTPEPAGPSSGSSLDAGAAAPAAGTLGNAADGQQPGVVGGSSSRSCSSSGSKAAAGQDQHAGTLERPVPPEVFEVLSAMLNSVLEVAAAQDDSRVVLTVLELASVISCTTGGTKRFLLSTLAGNPSIHTGCFWAFTFAFAVSSSYLNADDFVNVKDVVTGCLMRFAGYLAGVGIPGAAAWVLLMQMAAEHLQLAHAGPLEPALQLQVRRQLAQARQHFCMAQPAPAATAAGGGQYELPAITSTSSGQGSQQRPQQQPLSQQEAVMPQHVAAALQACGIALPTKQQESGAAAAADVTSSSSSMWQPALACSSPPPRSKAAVTIPAPAEVDQPTSGGGSRVSVSSGALGSAASDTEAPVTARRPASPASGASPDRAAASPATTPPASTPLGLSPRGAAGSPKTGAGSRAKEGYGSYAKLMSRQATNSPGSPLAPSASMTALDASPSVYGSLGGALVVEASEAAAVPAPLSVQGGCLTDQGAMAWAAVHSRAVVAMAAQSHTAVSAGLDGYLKVLDLSRGTMRLAASMSIPSLQDAAAGSAPPPEALPVLQLWYDGQRAAVGNSRHQAVWIVDLTGAQPSVELSGLGSAVSCLSPLYRNKDALLSGLTQASVVCGISSSTSSSSHMAAAYLWDLRRPRKPVSSLNFVPEPASAAAPVSTAGDADASAAGSLAAGVPGILCLSVHEDGALAAAGFRDGKVLTWDMRKGNAPLSECRAHTGPVRHVSFLPRAASTAAGLGRTPLIITGSDDWTACVWDAETGSCRGACVGHGGAVTAMQTIHSNSATRFVTGAADGSVGLWGLDGELVSLVAQHEEPVMLLKQGGDTLVSGAANKSCHVWGLQGLLPCAGAGGSSSAMANTGQLSVLLGSQQAPADVGAMAFDPMAEMLCAGHRDGVVSVWNCSYSTQCSTIFE